MDGKVTHFPDTVTDFINCFYFLFYKLVNKFNFSSLIQKSEI